ncbi:hypothetical protein SS05631_c29750 [Sinorhizobium sp. CCBAU 05631]|nr:hypothetical protein SS05631_c29750 [Sinorhizobium sp. CCBAU 05631]
MSAVPDNLLGADNLDRINRDTRPRLHAVSNERRRNQNGCEPRSARLRRSRKQSARRSPNV